MSVTKDPPVSPIESSSTRTSPETGRFDLTQYERRPDVKLAAEGFFYPIPRRVLRKKALILLAPKRHEAAPMVAAQGDDDLMNQPQC